MTKKIGLLTAGSDCPGLNAAIRAIGKACLGFFGMEIVGFQDGFQGLVENRSIHIESPALSGILSTGGTLLGTSRDQPHKMNVDDQTVDLTEKAIETYQKHKLHALACVGGRETLESAARLMQKGLNVICLPKSITNDINQTEAAIGFDSAREIAAQSIDRLHSTAYSHHRIIIVELMGRHTGWLTLSAGMAGGADVILIPEIPYDIEKVAEAILQRNRAGKRFSIVAVSERIISKEQNDFIERLRQVNARLRTEEERQRVDDQLQQIESEWADTTFHVSNKLKNLTGLETRITILGYLLRGGAPSAADRILATQFGTTCAVLIDKGHFGVMLGVQDGKIEPIPLEKVIGDHKLIPLDHPWIESAREVGTCMGN